MSRVAQIAEGFWNIRGSFRVLGVVDIGTHTSLTRLSSGGFALLDSYPLTGAVAQTVMQLTGGGDRVEAIINLHPFHTVHVEAVARTFPNAKLYGTSRHAARFVRLPWAPERRESEAFAERFAADFDFMVPKGVRFVPDNQNLHFASVLAFHRASQTLHVDDTLNWMPAPFGARLGFHPTLAAVLERRPGAATEFRAWAQDLVARCRTVEHICVAHARAARVEGADRISAQVQSALHRVEKVLRGHEARFGVATEAG